MSSPLTPVMDGRPERPVNVVTSFCLKSPPMVDTLSVVPGTSAGTLSSTVWLRPSGQIQRSSWPPAEDPDDDEQEARTGARSARVATPTTMRRARERRVGDRDMVVLDSVGMSVSGAGVGGWAARGGPRQARRRAPSGWSRASAR